MSDASRYWDLHTYKFSSAVSRAKSVYWGVELLNPRYCCYRCGRSHQIKDCHIRNIVCNFCIQEKRAHHESMLDRGKKKTGKTTNLMEEATVPDQVEFYAL